MSEPVRKFRSYKSHIFNHIALVIILPRNALIESDCSGVAMYTTSPNHNRTTIYIIFQLTNLFKYDQLTSNTLSFDPEDYFPRCE